MADAIASISGLYRQRAVVTKVLHLKRPRLVPICDSFVEAQLGAPREIAAIEAFRPDPSPVTGWTIAGHDDDRVDFDRGVFDT